MSPTGLADLEVKAVVLLSSSLRNYAVLYEADRKRFQGLPHVRTADCCRGFPCFLHQSDMKLGMRPKNIATIHVCDTDEPGPNPGAACPLSLLVMRDGKGK